MNTKTTAYKAPALEKGLLIIELLVREQIPLSMGDIASKLGYSKNEIFRMLVVLQHMEYIMRQQKSDLFTLTPKIFTMGMQVFPSSSVLEIALPEMRKMALDIRQSCHIAVLNRANIVVVARVESPAAIGFSVRPGHTVQADKSGSGLMLLAWQPKQRQGELLKIIDPKRTQPHLLQRLQDIRQRGYVMHNSYFHDSITDITVPVLYKQNHILAAITIPFLHNHNHPITAEQALEKLQTMVQDISQHSLHTI